jgi:hypothetical protein
LQGDYIEMTTWEQIDNGVPWTDTKKFLTIVPIILYVVMPSSSVVYHISTLFAVF